MKKILFGILLLIMSFSLTSCLEQLLPDTVEKEPEVVQLENTVSDIYDKVSPGCVGVYATNASNGASVGSGVVYKEENGTYYLVTNHHVVKDMTTFKVYRGGTKYYRATVVGTDSHNDIAVLTFSLDLLGGEPIYINDIFSYDEEIVKVGQTAIAIGCPLGLENYNTLTTGVVSRVSKTQIQTNAEINPGNSGGGLFNLSGRLIGINTEKKTYTTATDETGQSSTIPVEGIAYAIPLSIVKKCITDIESSKADIARPKLGITVTAINRYVSESTYVKHLPNSNDAGIIVIDAGSGVAYDAGLKVNDIILSMNNEEVYNLDDLSYFMSLVKVGETIKLNIYRSTTGKTLELSITLV
jgi:serine protease Do